MCQQRILSCKVVMEKNVGVYTGMSEQVGHISMPKSTGGIQFQQAAKAQYFNSTGLSRDLMH